LIGAVVLTFALQMAVIYVPFLQNIFDTTALSFGQLMLSLGLSAIIFIVVELSKWIRHLRERNK
jgi:Ca2+-transporting ATPase